MRWVRRMAFRLRTLLGRSGMERELREEVDFHLEMEARKHAAAGLPAAEARREALRRFGGVDRFRERTHDAWGGRLVEETAADLRFAGRQLVRRPGFALLALTTLAIGVGTTAALLGVVHALLLRPLPFDHADRMVAFWQPYNWRAAEYDAVRELELESIDAVAAFTLDGASLQSEGGSVVLTSALVTPGVFEVLGATPWLGRGFVREEHAPGAEDVVIVSHALWRQDLGGDPDVVGRRIRLDGRPVTVVGVMPEGFFFPVPEARIWRPLELDPASPEYQGRGWLAMTGRLRDGASEAAVSRDLRRMTTLLGERFDYPPAFDRTQDASVEPLRSHLLGDTRPALLLLLGAVGLLLLTACSNIAALLVARMSDRAGELAVRAGMGAGTGRLARQLLAEGAVLGTCGGLVAAGLTVALHGVLASAIPVTGGFEGLLTLSWKVPTAAAAFSTGLGVGLAIVPLRGILRGAAVPSMGGARTAGGTAAGPRLQWTLVAAQVVLAVTLVTGATLLVRSVDRLMDVELGLRPEGVVVADVFLGPGPPGERLSLHLALAERMAAVEGVEAAGTILRLPLRESGLQGGVWLEDRPDLRGTDAPNAYYRTVTPGTFDALGIDLVRGRAFTAADRGDARPVVVVSASFAELAWPGEDPLGRRVAPIGFEGEVWATVVGVVGDVRYEGPTAEAPRAVYRPAAQAPPWPTNMVLAVRAPTLGPAAVLETVRREVAALDPMAAVHRGSTMEQVLRTSVARPLRLRLFLGLFGALALLLGMVGVYGVVAYSVSRRTREFGVRMALGAEPRRLVRAVVGRGLVPVALGVAGGVGLSLLAARALRGFLFGVPAFDPLSFGSAALLLLAAGAAAAAAPARRAGRVDPVEALRSE